MNKKVISLILAVCLLFTAAAQNIGIVFAAEAPPFSVSAEYNGEKAEEIVVPQNEKRTLTAVCNPQEGEYTYNWQILADVKADLWVNITGQTANTLDVSYALLSSVLDQSGSAYLRCAVSSQGFTAYSKPVCATVSFTPNIAFEPVKASSSAPSSSPRALPRADDSEYVYITVNYYDAVSGNSPFGSHTSKIEKGTAFKEIVHSPTHLGFAPYYYSDSELNISADKIVAEAKNENSLYNPDNENTKAVKAASINFGELLGSNLVNENITVNVYYWAIDVPYAVKYMFQNIHDDYYTEQTKLYYTAQAKTGTIISDDELKSHAKDSSEGFSALYHYPEAVAADGSTVFECYYDRNYYYIKFDLGGGYGTDPIYARYDTPIVINTPTRPGYTFVGWDELTINDNGTPDKDSGDNNAETPPDRIGTENKYYKAIWEKADTTYTVIYWLENANDDGYSYLGYNTYPAEAEEEEVEVDTNLEDAEGVWDDPARLATLRFFELNKEMSDETVKVEGDGSTVANVYYDRKEYTLKYYYAREYRQGNTTHKQICGNTSLFSDKDREGNGTTDIDELLSYVNDNWSDVTEIPDLKNDNGYYQTGMDSIRHGDEDGRTNVRDYTYYYFTFTGKYGTDLTEEWPIEAFETATRSQNANGTRTAYFSAWNPEHHLYYGQHAMEEFNGNRTVKGRFQKLDRRILYDEKFDKNGDVREARFLAFWTNGLPNTKETWTKSRKWIYNIYLQNLDGTMPQAPSYSVTTYDTNDKPNEQTTPSIVGFNHSKTTSVLKTGTFDNNCQIHEMNFYYERAEYDVQFYNQGEILEQYQFNRVFEFPIGTTLMGLVKNGTAIPQYPSNLEPNAYYFEGWYTTANCADGSGYIRRYTKDGEWTTGKAYFDKMDANKLLLYANWKPVQREVKFFKTYEDYLQYREKPDDDLIFQTTNKGEKKDKIISIPHGNVVGTIDFPTPDTKGEQFVGWFYMNDGVKTMFTPADTPVKGNLNIFAEWKSETPQPYRIEYRRLDTKEEVAAPTIGYAYQGSTRTFIPKAGADLHQLYPDYNNGWYPTVASHSITIKPDNWDNPEVNVYIFYYVEVLNLPYTVKYVDKQTGKVLDQDKIVDTNTLSVVTERFEPIEKYVPDAFYKRLVLSAKLDENGNSITTAADNVITFYYTPSETTAFYAVHYMLQKPGTDPSKPESYVESDNYTDGTGTIGDEIPITPLIQTGYTVTNEAIAVHGEDNKEPEHLTLTDGKFTFTLNKNGSELYIYYKLNEYLYTVKYLEYGTETEKEVAPQKQGAATQYGKVVTEKAIEVNGYTALDPTEKSLTIKAYEENSGKTDPNVIVFYYIPKTYVAEYKVAGGTGGTLDNYSGKAVANADGIYHFQGSAPIPAEGYEFVGWYTDEKCTQSVDENWVDNKTNRLIPKIEGMKPEPEKNIYYAKFEELTGNLTIERENAGDEGNGDQVFVYKVANQTYPDLTIFVTVTGEKKSTTIHGLRYGKYTVEQVNNWSWRYSDKPKTVTLEEKGETTVEFGKASDKQKWLNGNSDVKVNEKASTSKKGRR